MARHRDHLSGWLWVLPSLAIPLVVSAVAWTHHVASEGHQIAPNVRFAGVDVSGLDPELAAEHVGWRETAFLQTPVTIDLGEGDVTLQAGDIGYDYLYGDTLAAVLSARHGNGPWGEFVSWVTTPIETVTVSDQYSFDEDLALSRLSEDDFVLKDPIEPQLADVDGTMTVVPGVEGVGVDLDQVIDDLEGAHISEGPVEVVADQAPLPPSMSDRDAQKVADGVNEITADGLAVAVGLRTARLTAAQLRRHVTSGFDHGEMTISVDVGGLEDDLEALFPEQRSDMQKPVLSVVDGEVRVIQPGAPPEVCCSTESVAAIATQVLDGGAPIYHLDTRPSRDPEMLEWASGAPVTEAVASFTTYHACCENRVTNIHTMADMLRGYYLIPGETLSLNDFVGPRTRDKGYLPAGAIRGGYMTDEVGGGVSQFVTTMFNAAFFGGLDLDEYQSHSVYFSRYPFGREATLSVPGPDLVLTNSTRYPVLIWPTYDDTSITVTLYSTENVDVEELDQRVTYRGQCRHSEIDRQRTFSDGRVLVDTIVANYRPDDGIDCKGNVIPKRD